MTHTVLAQSQTGKLTEKAKTDFFERLSKALDVAAYISEDAPEMTTQEAQETCRANGSSSTRPPGHGRPPGREPQDSNGLWARVLAAIF